MITLIIKLKNEFMKENKINKKFILNSIYFNSKIFFFALLFL